MVAESWNEFKKASRSSWGECARMDDEVVHYFWTMGNRIPSPALPEDYVWMRRCLELASKPCSSVSPNPLVGALLVQNSKIVGQGAHLRAGGEHAEIHALQEWQKSTLGHRSNPEGTAAPTLYVSLEPCNHHGKTPPCTEAILNSGIQTVVFGCSDPHPLVSGAGILRLLDAGLVVRGPVLEQECRWMNRRFEMACRRERPYVVLKWAMSADGFLDDGGPGPGARISGPLTSLITHQLRRQQAAILIGARTLIQDDPDLRAWRLGGPHPRVIVASDGHSLGGPYKALSRKPEPIFVDWLKTSSPLELAHSWCKELMQRGLHSLLVEGGRKTLDIFLQSGVWDEIHVFQDPALNLHRGTPAPQPPCQPATEKKVGKDIYRIYYPMP